MLRFEASHPLMYRCLKLTIKDLNASHYEMRIPPSPPPAKASACLTHYA